jgi:hypothetical protein
MLVVETNNEQQATIFLFQRLGIFVALKQPVVSIERSERYARQSG